MTTSFEVYIHAPWCQRRCPYCDFNVYIDNAPPFLVWKEKILQDWAWNKAHFSGTINSIYFGGGTPSLLPLPIVSEIITIIEPNAEEITLEVNPGSIPATQLQRYLEIGVNRISLGVQSFQPRFEKLLGRGGTIAQARELIATLQTLPFSSWSFDLMFGLPSQTLEELKADLLEIVKIRPPHISLYGLTYKTGTPFERALKRGQLQAVSEDNWIRMFETIVETLEAIGYQRYEVSNFRLPPHSARHNEAVWMGKPYMGLGPSAHGLLPDGRRTLYPSKWNEWLESAHPHCENSTEEQQVLDLILTKIRHRDGFHLREIQNRGFSIDPKTIEYLAQAETIDYNQGNIRLSTKGWIVVDFITERLSQALFAQEN